MTKDDLLARRNFIYHRTPDRRVRSERDALAFIEEVGFCFLFSSEGSELPTLYEAILGEPANWTGDHDVETGRVWRWKDSLPVARKCFYGKLLRAKPVLISLKMFPYFYAISGNYGDLDQYLEDYQDGRLSLPAKQVYEALLFHGAMPTSELRRKANLAGRDNAPAFERALAELQVGLKITKTGISEANRWHYCYIYDLLPRWLPEQVQKGLSIKSRDAYPVILHQYLQDVIVARQADIARLFAWPEETIVRAIAELVRAGDVRTNAVIEGTDGPWIGASAHLS